MKIKKHLITALAMTSMIATSTVTTYGANGAEAGVPLNKIPYTQITQDFGPKSIKELKPKNNFLQPDKQNVKAKSFVAKSYIDTKKVADEKASALVSAYGCTSVQYALIDNGKMVLSGNAGTYEKGSNTSLTADNMYGIGSISKVFVTTAVMKLADEGKVNLDTPVTHYIKNFKMADKRYKKITVRMLLNHSSGLMGSSFSNAILFNDNSTYAHDSLLKQLRTQRLKAAPGEYSVYCNDGFDLAEILVERVTGTSYTNYIAKNITGPLKMKDTKTPLSDFDRNKLAKTYYTGIDKALPVEDFNAIGCGGIYSSAEDLCNFATTFTKNSNGVLSDKAIKAMQSKEYSRGIWPSATDSIFSYGLGWDSVNLYPFNRYNIKALEKGGDTKFYHSSLIVLPKENVAMAVVSSGGSSSLDELMAEGVLLSALKEKGAISKIKADKTFAKPKKTVVPDKIKKFEGTYAAHSNFINIEISKSGILKESYPQIPQYGTQTYVYTKKGSFVSNDGTDSLKFVKAKNKKTYLEEESYVSAQYLGQTVDDEFIAQKDKVKKLSKAVSDAWKNREGKKYYALNERYSSMSYMYACPYAQVAFSKGFKGYYGMDKITGQNTATAFLDGPGMLARDQYDYKFYKKDNVEYLSSDGSIFVEEAAIGTLPTDDKFNCKINNDGYAQWYKISDASAGKEITVDMPKNAGFAVYNSNGSLVNDTVISGDNKVTLPKDGRIVFLGDANADFTVQYSTSSNE
ncbi:serine hydrolase domain-containing protein [Clostridium oryzae]|uniref:D-alanyl-D-alanine-carboxypeptidase/endopeptidase AmpH n=1 Tax=Clostridium oryzae TaxID=1450648 RepID=A0A1V4IR15_9CLOT|nr:serine hydrolase domain-containing protein [Clostridium oryzae]OPJ62244.1 D-alanyl-D-alanine-carboxypeptidase/endopeptidase AmpH precursor [Clostridium oryzae]